MRYEAKHSHFKHLARVIANFKNMAKTLAMRHQMYMCYHLSNPVGYFRTATLLVSHCVVITSTNKILIACFFTNSWISVSQQFGL